MTDFAQQITPSPAVLVTVGSIVRHAEEMLSDDGHDFDRGALIALIAHPDDLDVGPGRTRPPAGQAERDVIWQRAWRADPRAAATLELAA